MVQLDPNRPSKTFRGKWEDILAHSDEIPPGATLELNVFEEPSAIEEETGAFGGKSILEAFPHLFGTEHGGPSDMSEHPEKYMQGFGETKNPRTLEL